MRSLRNQDGGRVVVVAVAALGARLAMLVVIGVASLTLHQASFDLVVYTLAVSSAVQILLDPAVTSLVAVRWPDHDDDGRATMLWSGFVLQTFAGVAMTLTTTAFAFGARGGSQAAFLGASLGGLAAVEGVARYLRVVWQVEGHFARYAALDALIGGGRVATCIGLIFGGTLIAFAAASLIWACVLGVGLGFWAMRKRHRTAVWRLAREVWPYGASTFFSSLYSQAPAVLLGIVGELKAAAVYAVAARLTQATELVPAAISSVFLPRLSRESDSARRVTFAGQARLAIGVGVVFTLFVAALGPFGLRVLGIHGSGTWAVLAVLASVLPVKFLNYQYVALALADGRVRDRLRASMVVGVISVVCVCVVASRGALSVALTTLACECLLCLLLTRVSHAGSLYPREVQA